MKRVILLLSLFVLLALNFIPVDINPVLSYDGKEEYDPALGNLNTIKKLTVYIDDQAAKQNLKSGTLEYIELTEKVLKQRFYHSYSHYTLSQNWIAAFSERFLGYGLASVVDPDDIIKFPMAACSQQSIVMIEILHPKGYDYRSVGFAHHYALEFGVGSQWHYFDPNMEPKIPLKDREQSVWKGEAGTLLKYYDKSRYPQIETALGNKPIEFGKANANIAPYANLFHGVTGIASKTLWLLPLFLLLYPYRKMLKADIKKILFYSPPESAREVISVELR